MAFRVNGASPMIKTEVSGSCPSIASAQTGTMVLAVSGCTPDMCIDAVFASAHSAGFYIVGCQVLSANNVQVALWNATNGAIAHAGTTFRFVSK
jgi:hypothetical protein